MLAKKFLLDARARFCIVGPQISQNVVELVFPSLFAGREDLIQFYVNQNGGGINEDCCIVHCGNPDHRVPRGKWERIRIEGFYSISLDPDEKMHPFANMLRLHKTLLHGYAQVPEMRRFLEGHLPIAFDHSGMNAWINLTTGSIQFVNWYSYKEGPAEIAPSFQEFVSRFWINGPEPDFD